MLNQKRTGCSTEDSNSHIAELVMQLGGLPLALERAGAHIKALKCTFEQYIERFKKKRLKLLRLLVNVLERPGKFNKGNNKIT